MSSFFSGRSGPQSTPTDDAHPANLSSGQARRPASSTTRRHPLLIRSGRGTGNGLMMKKFTCVSTNRLAYQSSGTEDSTPSRNAWSFSFPAGQTKYGAAFVMKTLGGNSETITVRWFVLFVTSRNAIRGARHGNVDRSRRCSIGNSR